PPAGEALGIFSGAHPARRAAALRPRFLGRSPVLFPGFPVRFPTVPRLIVNADDFGLTPGVNRGILQAHREGLVTSTTLMANSAAFEDAVPLAKSCPSLKVGCHVVLIDGQPLLPAESVVSLAPGGQFRDNLLSFAAAALTGSLRPDEVEAEATAQIK